MDDTVPTAALNAETGEAEQGRLPAISQLQHIEWGVSHDKARLHSAEFPQVYLAGQTCLIDALRHYTGERVCEGKGHIRHTLLPGGTRTPCIIVQEGLNGLHSYSSIENSLGQFVNGTAGLCQIFCGNKR